MLGRLFYVLVIMGVLLAGGFLFNFIANEPGYLTLDYGDRIYEVTLFEAASILVVGILALMLAIWILNSVTAVIRFILGDETAFGGFFIRSRERRGLDALGKALAAIAVGDGKTARRKAEIAQDKLQNPALTRLLNAQAADLAGERGRAATYYKALMSEPETAFAGARGLLMHAMEAEDTERALMLATKARELNPRDRDTLDALYALQSRKFDWAAARTTLAAQVRAGHVPKLDAARREAALVLAQAENAERLGETEHARALAVEAAKLDPTNLDAVTEAVRQLIDAGSKRAASKLVMDGWRIAPHAKLAAAFAEIEPDEAPSQRRRRFEGLFALRSDHEETQLLRAELALVAEDWRAARLAIEELREVEPSARSCAIMAAIARGEGEPDHVVRGWLARALGAPRNDASDTLISHAAMLPLMIEPTPPREVGPAEAAGDAPASGAVAKVVTTGDAPTDEAPAGAARHHVEPGDDPSAQEPGRSRDGSRPRRPGTAKTDSREPAN